MSTNQRRSFVTLVLLGALLAGCAAPDAAPTATSAPSVPPQPAKIGDFKLTIVFDNTTTNPQNLEGWGFAAVVDYGDHRLLFDTGGSGSVLLDNLRLVDVDPATIEAVILSHQHYDHTNGLQALLDTGIHPIVYAPAEFTSAFKRQVEAKTTLVEVDEAVEIVPGVHTTRPIGRVVEEALVVETGDGAVVITGCAHPGVVAIVREAQKVTGSPITLVVGGFHLGSATKGEVSSIIDELRQLGVQKVMPCHCTGDDAIALFQSTFGDDFIAGGVGSTIAIPAN